MRLTRISASALLLAAALDGHLALGQPAAAPESSVALAPGQSLGMRSVRNMRDIGGYATRDGMVIRTKVLYRASMLARVSAADMRTIESLGLKCDYDLRREGERSNAPDRIPEGVKNIWLNVMADSLSSATPTGDGDVDARYFRIYREYVSLASARKAYSQLFTELQQEANLPAVFHCSAGKDRAGWATASLLTLLGVPREVVFEDYLRSNDYLPASLRVKREYLETAFDEVQTKYGTIEDYFSKALGINAAGQQALKERFLTRPSP